MKLRPPLRVLVFLVAGAAAGYLLGGGALPAKPKSCAHACSPPMPPTLTYRFASGSGDPAEVERWRGSNDAPNQLRLVYNALYLRGINDIAESFQLTVEPAK